MTTAAQSPDSAPETPPVRASREQRQRHPAGRIIMLCLILFLGSILRYFIWPPVGPLATTAPASSAFIEYRKEQWKNAGESREPTMKWRNLSQISPYLPLAVTIAEDDTFWDHSGFDFKGIREAIERNLSQGRLIAGGSTITQQLAKNLWFSPERSILRKIKEAIMAWRLEQTLEKKRILELYLNYAEWGNGIFGAEAAAITYFGKSASRLTPREAAILAAMLPNPLQRSPRSALVKRKANGIVRTMQRRGAL